MLNHKSVGAALIASTLLIGVGCERTQWAPASFSPAEAVRRIGDTAARCNTVHSFTLPERMLKRIRLSAGPNKAIISCSLQVLTGGVPLNTMAEVSGTATPLGGSPRSLEFREVTEEDTISYVAKFDIEAKVGIAFDILLLHPSTGVRHRLEFTQTAL